MKRAEVEAVKRRADQLVESYGLLRITSKLNDAVEHLCNIWKLDPIDVEILRPGKSIAVSNAVKSAASLVGGSGKTAAAEFAASHAAEVAKTAGDMAAKTAAMAGKANAAKGAARASLKAGLQAVRNNPYTATAVGVVAGLGGVGSGLVLKRELREFNEACYKLKLAEVDDI